MGGSEHEYERCEHVVEDDRDRPAEPALLRVSRHPQHVAHRHCSPVEEGEGDQGTRPTRPRIDMRGDDRTDQRQQQRAASAAGTGTGGCSTPRPGQLRARTRSVRRSSPRAAWRRRWTRWRPRAPILVSVDATPARLAPEIEATAYFVAAEGLANVIKHAAAS